MERVAKKQHKKILTIKSLYDKVIIQALCMYLPIQDILTFRCVSKQLCQLVTHVGFSKIILPNGKFDINFDFDKLFLFISTHNIGKKIAVFEYNTKISNSEIEKLVNCCTRLISLKLQNPLFITMRQIASAVNDFGLIEIAKNCPRLTSLSLYGTNMSSVTDTGIIAIAKSCTQLTSLDLSYINVSDSGLIELAKNCTLLTHLDLSATKITDSGLIEIAKNCTLLTFLVLCSTKITDSGLIEIAKNCTQLTYLDLRLCDNISNLERIELPKDCTVIRKINFTWS